MKMNSRKMSNKVRTIHRYLGFFLAGIMFIYGLSGITLTYRGTDTFKIDKQVTKVIDKGLEQPPQMRGTRDVKYNKETGEISYIQSQTPYLLGKMETMHKATNNSPLYYFNVFFGVCLLFFVLSAYWMFLPQTDIFKKAIYFTLGGIVLSVIMIMV